MVTDFLSATYVRIDQSGTTDLSAGLYLSASSDDSVLLVQVDLPTNLSIFDFLEGHEALASLGPTMYSRESSSGVSVFRGGASAQKVKYVLHSAQPNLPLAIKIFHPMLYLSQVDEIPREFKFVEETFWKAILGVNIVHKVEYILNVNSGDWSTIKGPAYAPYCQLPEVIREVVLRDSGSKSQEKPSDLRSAVALGFSLLNSFADAATELRIAAHRCSVLSFLNRYHRGSLDRLEELAEAFFAVDQNDWNSIVNIVASEALARNIRPDFKDEENKVLYQMTERNRELINDFELLELNRLMYDFNIFRYVVPDEKKPKNIDDLNTNEAKATAREYTRKLQTLNSIVKSSDRSDS